MSQPETTDLESKGENAGSPCCGARHLPLGPSKYKCQSCSKPFTREDLNEWVVFLEHFIKTCRSRGLPISRLSASSPPFSLEQVAKARQACCWDKVPADFTPEFCRDKFLVYSWLQTSSDAEDFSAALQGVLDGEFERPRRRLVSRIRREYNYDERDLIEICLAVSWFKSEDKTGGNRKLASIMTNKTNINYNRPTCDYRTPKAWFEHNPNGFKQHLQRLRDKASSHGFDDNIPPDYWKLYR